MTKRLLMILIVIAIVAGGGYYAFKQLMPEKSEEAQGPIYSTFETKKSDISAGVEISGQLNASRSGGIRVPGDMYSGQTVQYVIEEFLVDEGDEITQGQVVVRLLANEIHNKLDDIREQIDSQKKQLSQLTGLPISEVDYINPSQGLKITAPISGRIMNLDAKEGKKISQGYIVASIVDNSKFKVSAKLTPSEFGMVSEGQTVALSFPYFDGAIEGTITELNSSAVPDNSEEGKFGTNFVYMATIEANNPGLIQANMEVKVGLSRGDNQSVASIHYFMYPGIVEGFVNEEKLVAPVEAVATQVHVKGMQEVKKGDVIVTMAGADVRDMIQEKVEKIRELNNEMRDYYSKLDQLEIRSPMDGIVGGIWRQQGETVRGGEWLGDVYNTSDMRIWAEIDDIDVLQVKQEAPVTITVDALPGEKFQGKVVRISTMGKDRNGLTRFQVEIEVIGGPQLRPGMQARAYVDAGSAQGVLIVPLEAIFEEDGVSKVEILGDDGIPRVEAIKLGLMNDKYAEVVEGLKEGDKVITGSTADLLPSQHIKSNDPILPSGGGENNDGNNGDNIDGNNN